jgi:hypothetical protein
MPTDLSKTAYEHHRDIIQSPYYHSDSEFRMQPSSSVYHAARRKAMRLWGTCSSSALFRHCWPRPESGRKTGPFSVVVLQLKLAERMVATFQQDSNRRRRGGSLANAPAAGASLRRRSGGNGLRSAAIDAEPPNGSTSQFFHGHFTVAR